MFPRKPPSVLGMMLNMQYGNLLKYIVYQPFLILLLKAFDNRKGLGLL